MTSCIGKLTILAGLATVAGCAALEQVQPALPGKHSLVREQLVIHSDFPLAAQHRLMEELTARRFDLGRRLGLPLSDEPIHVYLFDDSDRFDRFMRLHYPGFPRRRAFFVETDTRLMVYAHWGDRVAEDLRHEVTHAYLHSMVPRVSLWLDEGLAEYFEVPRGRGGLNRVHLDRLRARLERGDWRPDLRRIEQLSLPFDMTQDDYAESWAWVHFLLNSSSDQGGLLHEHLLRVRQNGSAEPLSVRLGPMLAQFEQMLIDHVGRQVSGARSFNPNTVHILRKPMLAPSPATAKPGKTAPLPVAGDQANKKHERYWN